MTTEDLDDELSAAPTELRQAYKEYKAALQKLLFTLCSSVAVQYADSGLPNVKICQSAMRSFPGFRMTHTASMSRNSGSRDREVSVYDLMTLDDEPEMNFEEDP